MTRNDASRGDSVLAVDKRSDPQGSAATSRSSPDDSALTPPLSSPELETLARLATECVEAKAAYLLLEQDSDEWVAGVRRSFAAVREFSAYVTPECILGLIEAAQRGAEDAALVDWQQGNVCAVLVRDGGGEEREYVCDSRAEESFREFLVRVQEEEARESPAPEERDDA